VVSACGTSRSDRPKAGSKLFRQGDLRTAAPTLSPRAANVQSVPDGEPKRTIADSLCSQPADPPRTLHRYVAPDKGDDVSHEVYLAAWAQKKATVYTAASFIGDVNARLRVAARGQLRDADNLEPVRLDPLLWEIKWRSGRTRHHRMYHAEPGSTGDEPAIVALRFHLKDVSSANQDTIDALQDAEMEIASERYADGVKKKWGHKRDCAGCLDP
jgi:hypothetical protein